MTVQVETSIEFVNRIANDPAVRPFIDYRASASPMDFSPALERRSTETGIVILSNGEDACCVFELTDHRRFQVHYLFGPTCRGRKAVAFGKEVAAHMFDRNWADSIWGATPKSNPKAIWFNRQMGGRKFGERVFEKEGEVELYELVRPH